MPIAVITGANSGLGFAIACRLIEAVEGITIVVTCRSTAKAEDTLRRLEHRYPAKTLKLDYALLDLASMRSVHDTAKELKERFGRIDYLYLNAGAGDFIGLDWKQLALDFWNGFIAALTAPTYKLQRIGRKSGDGLGWVFQCNVFGHYYLMNEVLPVMKDGGKVIWTSSLEAFPWAFSYPDPTKTLSDVADSSASTPSDTLQLLINTHSYEGSKRLTDILHVASYKSIFESYKVRQYLTHPGICGTNIMADHLIKPFFWGMFACFYVARLFGSIWHTCTAHKGALSSLYCAVIDDEMSKKFGSGTDRWGNERIVRQEVEEYDEEEGNLVHKAMNDLYKEWKEKLEKEDQEV
ncbi:NAD(P)-binding protein [Saitoella complicata NRRL Y-17804]|uniref:NAD(P)-binding protein n=1 Tax=Saitoella complicata (strain BCRC 22490 / CBS 7301 / JCM 7358 / NBRC 10748 / NRRL Y-17804) TaxID=698492 RepID=UPI000866D000|nr:NAD(P)-binding protein [Saitoella complicata NRRL Y-17804]ODQ51562.1 NAD(P)-binding protein [Saitoella complicata NRRL Y-17804]